jgi:hypothetical protein
MPLSLRSFVSPKKRIGIRYLFGALWLPRFRNCCTSGAIRALTIPTLNRAGYADVLSASPCYTARLAMSGWSRVSVVRAVFWLTAIILGIAQAWGERHSIYSDGISYVEIATAYTRHDWANAINAYWSPLFSWMLALAFLTLHPSPYWQAATAHLVMFVSYIVTLLCFEFFMRELIRTQQSDPTDTEGMLGPFTMYVAGYCSILFAALGMSVRIGSLSPDTIAMALVLALVGLILRIRRTGGSALTFIWFGALSASCYLVKAALLSTVVVSFVTILILLWSRRRMLLRPAAIMIGCSALIAGPFVAGISRKEGKFSLGESGRLNYGWEISGAHRWIHWQGEPGDIGTAKHPTSLVVTSPKTFTFAEPIVATYPPWYDPSYWYDGIQPKVRLKKQIWVFIVNVSVALYLLVKSPVLLPTFGLIMLTGIGSWWRRITGWWPALLPVIAGITVYSLVFVERRYVNPYLVIIWMTSLAAIRIRAKWLKTWAPRAISIFALLFIAGFVRATDVGPLKEMFQDLVHGHEQVPNLNYLLAQRLRELGLCPGDKVAYIGTGINAEWARLDGVRVVAEVPLMNSRDERLFDNYPIDDISQIQAFWKATDGIFCRDLAAKWPPVFPAANANPELSRFHQMNSRYFDLLQTPVHGVLTPCLSRIPERHANHR